jgi:hypothetical protein
MLKVVELVMSIKKQETITSEYVDGAEGLHAVTGALIHDI